MACRVVEHLVAFVAGGGQVSSEPASCQAASVVPWVAVVVAASFPAVVVQDSSYQAETYVSAVVVAVVATFVVSAVATVAVVVTVVAAAAFEDSFLAEAVEYFQPAVVVVAFAVAADAFEDSFLAGADC